MENFKSPLALALLTACCLSLTACQSTSADEDEPECISQPTEACADEDDDRGYDPCLVNSNLPVCKS
jgi:hypothetical protein